MMNNILRPVIANYTEKNIFRQSFGPPLYRHVIRCIRCNSASLPPNSKSEHRALEFMGDSYTIIVIEKLT